MPSARGLDCGVLYSCLGYHCGCSDLKIVACELVARIAYLFQNAPDPIDELGFGQQSKLGINEHGPVNHHKQRGMLMQLPLGIARFLSS